MVFAQTDGIVSVLLDHTRTRGPSVARMRDFYHRFVYQSHLVSKQSSFFLLYNCQSYV